MITKGSAFTYFFERENIENLSNLLKNKKINAEYYSITGLPSWGIVISDDDATVVEYKLKYGV